MGHKNVYISLWWATMLIMLRITTSLRGLWWSYLTPTASFIVTLNMIYNTIIFIQNGLVFWNIRMEDNGWNQGRINHKADQAKYLGPREKMGPTKVKTQEKGAYETQHVGNILEQSLKKNFWLSKCDKVPRAYETLNPGLDVIST